MMKDVLENAINLRDMLGGKGFHLHVLSTVCPVPSFFVVQPDYDEEDVLEKFDALGTDFVSVRSSATCEDGENASFAGMFESELNVDRPSLLASIKRIIASGEGERVQKYCEIKGINEKPRMRVVVQKMVRARVSGVCFTKTFGTKQKEGGRLIIEACLGLGEALVSSRVTPDTYIVSRSKLETKDVKIGHQKEMLKGTEYESVPFHMRNAKKLTDEEIKQIATMALQIETKLGYPASDIEWAFEGEELYILQARAYTGAE